jgi:hypothetical protein
MRRPGHDKSCGIHISIEANREKCVSTATEFAHEISAGILVSSTDKPEKPRKTGSLKPEKPDVMNDALTFTGFTNKLLQISHGFGFMTKSKPVTKALHFWPKKLA